MSAAPASVWFTPEEVSLRLRISLRDVRGLCATGQIAWRPANPNARCVRYLISEEAVVAFEKATTRPATVRPLRRVS